MIMAYRQAFRLRDELRESRAARSMLISRLISISSTDPRYSALTLALAVSHAEYAGLLGRAKDLLAITDRVSYILEMPTGEALDALIRFYAARAESHARAAG